MHFHDAYQLGEIFPTAHLAALPFRHRALTIKRDGARSVCSVGAGSGHARRDVALTFRTIVVSIRGAASRFVHCERTTSHGFTQGMRLFVMNST